MLFFSVPALLAFLPVIAGAGLLALWRGRNARHPVSSARLWANLGDSAGGAKKRRVDPLWLLVFLAALLAALALPGPRWRSEPNPDVPRAEVHWSLRSLDGQPPELLLQIDHPRNLGTTLAAEYLPGADPDRWPKELATAGEEFSLADALHGIILKPPLSPEATKLSVRLHAVDRRSILATVTFTRPQRPPFALLTQTAPGRHIDPDLYRVFAINPAARPDDPRISPAVLLVDDPHFVLDGAGGQGAAERLLIAAPDTPLPGITLGQPFKPVPGGPKPLGLPPYIHLARVEVHQARAATLSPEWTVDATVDGRPWLATRRMADGRMLAWLASSPARDTNWPLDDSFVLYFSNLLERALGPASSAQPAGPAVVDWQEHPLAGEKAAKTGREVPLGPALGIAAILLLLSAVGLLLRRSSAA